MNEDTEIHTNILSKVPKVVLGFWIIKILATTVGETGGDALSMTFELGYLVSTLIFLVYFAISLFFQIRANRYHPFLYWAVVVATTTVGTTTSDCLDRTLKLGYVKSSILLFCGVLVVLFVWKLVAGRLQFENITNKRDELFYWLTILVSNTLGTALGDFVASTAGVGFVTGAGIFAILIAIVVLAHYFTKIPGSLLFWAAYVLTRPLGATLGDTLTKPVDEGGLNMGRVACSLTIAVAMIIAIIINERIVSNRKQTTGAS